MPGEHAAHNASSADIWLDCGLYYHHKLQAEAAGVEYDSGSDAANRGTALHDLAERALQSLFQSDLLVSDAIDLALEQVLNRETEAESCRTFEWLEGQGGDLKDEDYEQLETALIAAKDLLEAHGCDKVRTEVKVPLTHEPESNGTIDVLGLTDEHIIVADYKFGRMEKHPSCDQLKIYGANILRRLRPWLDQNGLKPEIVLAIIQPQLYREAVTVTVSAESLERYRGYVEETVSRQISGADTRGADSLETCTWCPFKASCGQYTRLVTGLVDDLIGGGLTDERIEQVVRSKSELTKAIGDCVEQVVEHPERFPNWARVDVSNGRAWNPALSELQLQNELQSRSATEFLTIASFAKVRDANPKLDLRDLSIEKGSHVRLRYGAAEQKEPAKRPAAKSSPKKAAAKKAAAKKTRGKKKK